MSLLAFPRLPSRVASRQTLLVLRPAPRSSIHIIIKARLHSPHPHHVQQPSLRLSTPFPGRQNAAFFTSKLNPRFASSRPRTSQPLGTRIAVWIFFLTSAMIWFGIDYLLWRPLNTTTFVPFTIVSREQISPTAFVLTVQPSKSMPWTGLLRIFNLLPIVGRDLARGLDDELFDDIWKRGATWSVEVKQPQLQVARDYTPLPPVVDRLTRRREMKKGQAWSNPELKFLIRRMDGGEVSNYLAGLKVGDEVELRGPHYGFDVGRRLGDMDRVVFLAGGTGIAPALQVVKAVLQGERREGQELKEGPRVDVLWANRQRADCVGCPEVRDALGELEGNGGPVLDQLAELQRRYPERLTVKCTVDEERSFVQMETLAGLVMSGVRGTEGGQETQDCWLHSQEAVTWRPAADVDAKKKPAKEVDHCGCGSGKNLLFVSGPDGFIDHFAGAKRWANGMELQGPVGGILGKMKAKYPDAMNDWLVLKL